MDKKLIMAATIIAIASLLISVIYDPLDIKYPVFLLLDWIQWGMIISASWLALSIIAALLTAVFVLTNLTTKMNIGKSYIDWWSKREWYLLKKGN